MYALLIGQGLCFVVIGMWPVVRIRSFERIAGPKRNTWLVKCFGALIACVGVAFLVSALEANVNTAGLAATIGYTAVLAATDFWCVSKGIISRSYLLNGWIEILVVAEWAVILLSH